MWNVLNVLDCISVGDGIIVGFAVKIAAIFRRRVGLRLAAVRRAMQYPAANDEFPEAA